MRSLVSTVVVALGAALALSCTTPRKTVAVEPGVPDAPVVARVEPSGFAPKPDPDRPSTAGIAAVGPKMTSGRGRVEPYASPFVHFTRPMRPNESTLTFEVSGGIGGTTVWTDPYRASFSLDEMLELGRTYRVRARGRVVQDDGTTLEVDESWSFSTRSPNLALSVVDVARPWDSDVTDEAEPITAHARVGIDVTSDQVIAIRSLQRHAKARAWPVGMTSEVAKPVPITIAHGRRSHGLPEELEWNGEGAVHIHPVGRWPANHHVEITVDADYAPEDSGPIGEPVSTRFRVMEGNTFTVACGVDHGDGCGPGGIVVSFAMPVPSRDLAKVRVTPKPQGLLVHSYDEYSVALMGAFEIGKTYRVEVPRNLRDRVGQKAVGPLSRSLTFVPPPPVVELVATSGVLRPDLPPTIGLESRWVRKALLRAAVPSTRAWLALQDQNLDTMPFPTDVVELVEREIDLAPSGRYAWSSVALDVATLTKHRGPVLIEIVPGEVLDVARGRGRPETKRGLFQVTEHGLAVWRSPSSTRVWVRDNSTLEVEADASVQVLDDAGEVVHRAKTDARGVAVLPSARVLSPRATVVVADDRGPALLRVGDPSKHEAWQDRGEDRWLSSVVTERRLYRPGELVSVVGWASISTTRSGHGLLRPKVGAPVVLELIDGDGEVAARVRASMTKHGKYFGRLALPSTAGLGSWSVRATLPERGEGLTHMAEAKVGARFEVRDVEAPAFEVRTALKAAHVVRSTPIELVAHAGYYYGGAVPIARHRATSECVETSAEPAGLERGWRSLRGGSDGFYTRVSPETTVESGVAGELRATVATDALPKGIELSCNTAVAIQDASFTEVGGSERWFVHPTRYVVGRSEGAHLTRRIHVRALTSTEMKRTGHAATVVFERLEERRTKDGSTETKRVPVRRCTLETTTSGPDAVCEVSRVEPGFYEIVTRATVDGRDLVLRETWRADAPPKKPPPPTKRSWLEMTIEPTNPAPGDAVTVELLGPPVTGLGVLALEHGGLRELRPFELRDGVAKLQLRATDAWVPGVRLDAFVVSRGDRPEDPPRTWRDSGSIEVGAEHRRLDVALDAPKIAGAGDEVAITVRVAGHDGAPIDGRVALWAVDEGIHALLEPVIPDLVQTFAVRRNVDTQLFETFSSVLRPYVVRADPFEDGVYYGGFGSGSGAGMGGRGVRSPAVRAGSSTTRARFEATPIFVGDAPVEDGVAIVRGQMPENLTTFRLTAIASAEVEAGPGLGRFGHADAQIQLTAPLIVRAAMPRMLRPGDTSELGLIVDNLAGGKGRLEVEIEAVDGATHLELVGPTKHTIEVDAGAQQRFVVTSRAKSAGVVALEVRARLVGAKTIEDAIRTELPIEKPTGFRRHAAVYGSLAQAKPFAVELARPRDATSEGVGVDVQLASSLLGDLQPMARDLVAYPYGCVEQTSSGLLPLVALAGLDRRGYLDVAVDEHIQAGIARLRSMQVGGSALGYWPGATSKHLWGSGYALWVLEALVKAGHPVPDSLRVGVRDALMAELGEAGAGASIDDVAATMVVAALTAGGAKPTATIERLYLARDELPTFARALLLTAAFDTDPKGAIATTLVKELLTEIEEREGVATVAPAGGWYPEYFDSSVRTTALVMMALGRAIPDDPVVEKLARGIVRLRADDRVRNTQERAYALLALSEFARTHETIAPDLAAEVFIAGRDAGKTKLVGTTAPPSHHTATIRPKTDERVVVAAEGKGRLYYRVGMAWTPEGAGKTAESYGMKVERSLRADGSGVVAAADEAGTPTFVAGELVALDVEINVDRLERYVAIEVPIAPGFEPVDTSLGKGAAARVATGSRGAWVSHQELRRDRAVIFADVLRRGRHRTTVFLRAIAAGDYEMPAAAANAMYEPERQGNSARMRVRIAPRP